MKTKPLWHDRSEEPVFVEEYAKYEGNQAYNRIAYLVSAPVEPDSGRNATFIESMRIYKEDTWRYGSWKVRREEEGVVKWCYFDALVSDDVQIPDKKEIIKPFLRELADLLEKYEIVLEVNAEPDSEFPESAYGSLDILDKRGNVIYTMLCQYLSPGSIREEAKQNERLQNLSDAVAETPHD